MQLNNSKLYKNSSFINGDWQQASSTFSVTNPANEQVISEVGEVSPQQLELAANSAYQALNAWQGKTVDERSIILRRWFDLIMGAQADLAAIITQEQGKSRTEAMGEVAYGAKYIEWYAEEARRINGEVLPVNQNGRRALVLKRPVGVVTAITPWNFPSAMILRKAAAALAAGCSFIVKPSELTPLSALALAELSLEAGVPAGVFNVVVGSSAQAIGEILTTHPKVSKFSFTGSTQVGKKLLQQCASGVKKTSMELGGNAPFIVFEDADIDAAVKGAIASKFRNAGQTCVCANRFFVHKNIKQEFISKLKQKVSALNISDGDSTEFDVGPLISAKAVNKVETLLNQALELGAKLLCGGARINKVGNYFTPTIIDNVEPNMDIFNTEIFGPVVSIIEFENESDVIKLANQTEYGLSSYAYTQNISRVWRLSEQLDFGMVGINEGVLSNAAAPFGGTKQSGMGREGGHWGIEDYLETRYVCIGGLN